MANLQEKLFWEPGIYQLETSDPVLAGPDGIDNLQGKQLANRTVYLKDQVEQLASGKQPAGNAAKLSAARKIEATGDGNWNVMFDGSRDVSGQLTLRDSGVAPGDYGIVTVDAKGRVTKARQMSGDDVPAHDWGKIVSGKPTTLAGYGIGDGASKADLQNAVNSLVSGAPANLNTLQELAAAVNNDSKYSATVDGKLASKADKATTLAGYGITDAQPSNPDLAALANLKGAAGLYVNTGPGAATVRTLGAGQGVTVSNGDGKAGNPTVALALSGATAGTYGMVTVDAMGRVTAGRQMAASDVPLLDWSKIATGQPTTLAGYGITDAASKDSQGRLWGTTVRADKGLPSGDGSNVGFAFGPDGDTGLFADMSGDKPVSGTSVLGMYINSSKVLGVDKAGAVWTPAYGMLDDKFAAKADFQAAIDGPVMSFRGELEDDSDLNVIQANGWVRQRMNVRAASGKNYPPIKDAGALTTLNSGSMTFQQYQTHHPKNTQLFFRSRYDDMWSDWKQVWHSGNLVFSSVVEGNGYQKLPSGLIIQWGQGSLTATLGLPSGFSTALFATGEITFRTSFPTVCCSIMVNGNENSVSGQVQEGYFWVGGRSKEKATIGYTQAFGSSGVGERTAFDWIAIGY
ncbi:hypothetical protein LQR31_03055 [Chromobacterium vaccinii]|uniref:pyocin knob domain-containing protein n=1 Tax=Chromobacterium vaccinii TaxID=1108595 RepID=UPI001E3640B2|nr:pyocin knob domain-containing protein [Chromobacterium vaccinii]MCD4483450.1 hypothetical protein [Chromobacterium vaccinii]